MAYSVGVSAALVALLAVFYRFVVYPAYFCPMSQIPTLHWTSRHSGLYLQWIRYTGQENATVFKRHRLKGPILRLAPNVLGLNCFDGGLKQIYLGGFPKSSFYPKGFINYGTFPMFAMTDNKQHSARKRLFASVMSKSSLISSESVKQVTDAILYDRLIPLLSKHAARDERLDVLPLNFSYSMDSFVNWQFGLRNGSNFIQNAEERRMYLDAFFGREKSSFWPVEAPTLTWALEKIGIRLVPKSVDIGTANIENWNMIMCDKAEEMIREDQDIAPIDYPTLMAQALRTMGKDAVNGGVKEKYPNRNEIACEMFSQSSAAHETSGITMTYAMFELSRRPALCERLRKELMTLDPPLLASKRGLPDPKVVLELPLLDAIVMETLRVYPAVPGGQPRVTPKPVNSLGGVDNIPGGVEVMCYAHCLHRNEDVFPEPEAWRPERWLESSPEQLTIMRRYFWGFGSGASMCIGSNFAFYSIKFGLAGVYTNFKTTVHDHGDMALLDAYLAGPKGERLELKFHAVE